MFVFCLECEQTTLKCEDGWERAVRKTTQNSRTAKKYKNNADFVHKTKTMQQKSTRSNESQQRQFAVVGYSSVSASITICGTTDCNYTFRLSLSSGLILPHRPKSDHTEKGACESSNLQPSTQIYFIKSALYCCWCFVAACTFILDCMFYS